MQTLLTSTQMRAVDAYTIANEPILSIDLLEKAACAFVKVFEKEVRERATKIAVFCGQGNNGGDGLAIARLLHKEKYTNITVYLLRFSQNCSADFTESLARLSNIPIPIVEINDPKELAFDAHVLLDAMLGSGLNKPFAGEFALVAKIVKDNGCQVISVDVPSGFNTEGPISNPYMGIKANLVIAFQRPKINFFFPESVEAMDRYKIVDIGLDEDFIERKESNWKLTTSSDIRELIEPRKKFTHKGTYGHALIMAGNTTTMGAALLTASACLFAGAGLTTVCLPQSGLIALNTMLPEVMALPRAKDLAMEAFEKFNAIAIGPGLGTDEENERFLEQLLTLKKPLIIDADALTILSRRRDLLDELPIGSILTPHMKEFDRLFGAHQDWWTRVETAVKEAKSRKWVILLKNQYTFVCLPNGEIKINQTGNPAMAAGGMGDVLTGIIVSFVAQGYSSANAAVLATYLHGKAGNQLAKKSFIVTASAVARRVPKVMKALGVESRRILSK